MCLPCPSADLHRQRDPRGELGDAMIEERHAGLEADRHRRPVDLAQDIVGQIGDRVAIHHPQRVGRAAGDVHVERSPAVMPRPRPAMARGPFVEEARHRHRRSCAPSRRRAAPSGPSRRNAAAAAPADPRQPFQTSDGKRLSGAPSAARTAAARFCRLLPQPRRHEMAVVAGEQFVAAVARTARP